MTTLNFAMIMMMIGSNMSPMHIENIATPMIHPTVKVEIAKEMVLPAAPIEKKEAVSSVSVRTINEKVVPAAPIEKREVPKGINQDKTYEQCMNEAFERIYEEVNRLLDKIPEQTDEQFQLQRGM